MRELSPGPDELTIRYKLWQTKPVIWFAMLTASCVALVIYQPGAWPMLLGPPLVFVRGYLRMRAMLLEVTPAVVRARQGRMRRLRDLEADRAEICSIDYCPRRIMFRGTHGQSLMAPYPFWTLEQVVQVAQVLDVPVYDRRGKFRLKTLMREELADGRLVKGDSSAGWWS